MPSSLLEDKVVVGLEGILEARVTGMSYTASEVPLEREVGMAGA